MATFADLTAKLKLDISNFATGIRNASAQANKFASNLSGQINTGMVDPTKKAKFEFKDVGRIVQGILISKAFYSGLNAIRNAKDAVWEFAKQLEYAQMTYSNLFGSTELATEFINVLKDFAAVTPFAFSDAEAAAKRLLAYGIQSKNVMYVMQGILAASTAQQKPEMIESVSRAMGQIYTKGRLMNEEMRQLAEAGIPAYEILRDKLGLTQEQLQNLGDQSIPASKAINALVEGITERFGGVLKQSSKTITGYISNIADNATMLISGMFKPLMSKVRGALGTVEGFVSKMREIFDTKGIGGVFEALVPPELQGAVRTLIANLKNLWTIFKELLKAVNEIFKALRAALLPVLNALLPIITAIIATVVGLLRIITSNQKLMRGLIAVILGCAAAWVIYKTKMLLAAAATAIVKGLTAVVKGLSTALTFLVAHPIWALLILGVGIFIALTGASDKFAASINKIFSSLTSLGGIDPSKLLLPESKDRASDLDKFNEALDDTNDALGETSKNSAKAAKGLLSFDEAFKLNDSNGSGIDTDSIEIPDIGDIGAGINLDDFWGDTDFGSIATGFVTNLVDALGGKENLLGAGIGAVLGGVLGGIIGGPLGVKIGAAIGALAGWFWNDVANALGLTDVGKLAVPIAGTLGAAIGFIAGGPVGAAIGGGIGILVGWITDKVAKGIQTGDWRGAAAPIGIGLGAGIGMIVGGPVGAAIGAAIGGLVGWLGELIATNWDGISGWFDQAGKDIADFARNSGKYLSTGFAYMSDKTGQFFNAMGDWINSGLGPLLERFGTFFTDIWNGFTSFFTNAVQGVGTWFSNIYDTVATALSGLFTTIGTFFTNAWNSVVTGFNNIITAIQTALSNAWNAVTTAFSNIVTSIGTALTNAWNAVVDFFGRIVNSIATALSNAWTSVTSFFGNIYNTIKNSVSNMFTAVSDGIANIYNSFKNWLGNLWDNVFGKLFGWLDDGIEKLKEFFGFTPKSDPSYDVPSPVVPKPASALAGHAIGGVFNREHVARFAEGNKREAIIPLENDGALQPFVDAVSNGVMQGLMPTVAMLGGKQSNSDDLRPLYVGTLIADERSLRELNRRMNVIKIEEDQRRG